MGTLWPLLRHCRSLIIKNTRDWCIAECINVFVLEWERSFSKLFFSFSRATANLLTVINPIPTRPRFCGHVAGGCSRGEDIEACWLVSRRDPSRCGLLQ